MKKGVGWRGGGIKGGKREEGRRVEGRESGKRIGKEDILNGRLVI